MLSIIEAVVVREQIFPIISIMFCYGLYQNFTFDKSASILMKFNFISSKLILL